ncbi:PIN domain-containing protein [Rhodocyclaceae bacterium SMB388]
MAFQNAALRLISSITWMDVMVGADAQSEAAVRAFLAGFTQVTITPRIAELAVERRREKRLRLPDAIIWASAKSEGAVLVTRNTKDFPEHHCDAHVPYRL